MAEQGWITQVAAAAGVAAGAGAAQLGIGYGLGVVVWPTTPFIGDAVWLGSLVWAVWIAAGSTVFGSVAALRLGTGTAGAASGALARLTLVFAAAVGALSTIALVALPARAVVRSDTFSPGCTAAGYAALGVLLGMVIAWWAAASRSVAANVLATSAGLWSLAIVAIVTGLRTAGPAAGVQLGHWRMTAIGDEFFYGTVYWPGALLALVAALLIGILAAWPAVRRGETGLGVAASGAVGPLLMATAYFTVAPQLTGARGMLQSAYLISPYTVLAGLAGSALAVALGQKAQDRRTVRRTPASRSTESAAAPALSVEPAAAPPADRLVVGWLEPNGGTSAQQRRARSSREHPSGADAPAIGTVDRPPAATGPTKPSAPLPEPTPTPPRRPARSTVKAPPANPTVATINPPRPTPVAGKPAGTAARKGATTSNKGTAHGAAAGAGKPRRGAGPDPTVGAGGAAADQGGTAAAKAGPAVDPAAGKGLQSPLSAAPADNVPPQVDDSGASDSDRDGIKNRLRRFGRRSGGDSAQN